jgi:hypothetical protein
VAIVWLLRGRAPAIWMRPGLGNDALQKCDLIDGLRGLRGVRGLVESPSGNCQGNFRALGESDPANPADPAKVALGSEGMAGKRRLSWTGGCQPCPRVNGPPPTSRRRLFHSLDHVVKAITVCRVATARVAPRAG